ncbi:hypothetical protein BLA29_013280, partial [Euroglyphus maynei]
MDVKNRLIGRNFAIYQRIFQLYKLCEYNHLNSPLYLTSSLSYMKHFQCEYNVSLGRNDEPDNCGNDDDIDMDNNRQNPPDINGVHQSDHKNPNNSDVNDSDDEQNE